MGRQNMERLYKYGTFVAALSKSVKKILVKIQSCSAFEARSLNFYSQKLCSR